MSITGPSDAGVSNVIAISVDAPQFIEKGSTIGVNTLLKNTGSTKVGPFIAGIFLSKTNVINTHTDRLIGEMNVKSGMEAHQEFNFHETVQVPDDVTDGDYYVGVVPNLEGAFAANRKKLVQNAFQSPYVKTAVLNNHFVAPFYPSGSTSDFSGLKNNPPAEFTVGFYQLLGKSCDPSKLTTDGGTIYSPVAQNSDIRTRISSGLNVGVSIGGALGANTSSIFEKCDEAEIKTILNTLAASGIASLDIDIEGKEFGSGSGGPDVNYTKYLSIIKWFKATYPDITISFTFPVYSYYWANGWTPDFKIFLINADGFVSQYRIMDIGVGSPSLSKLINYWDESISRLPNFTSTKIYAVIDPWNDLDKAMTPKDAFDFLNYIRSGRSAGITFNGLDKDSGLKWYTCLLNNSASACSSTRP